MDYRGLENRGLGWDAMDYQEFLLTLPINNFHHFDDPNDWLDAYSHHYPTEDQRTEIYETEVLTNHLV